MQVSVETLKGLERKVTISVPTEKVEEEVSLRLKNLARKVKVDGFRPGKAPFPVIKKRYSDGVRQEVARDMVQSTLSEAMEQKKLVPVGYPSIEPEQLEEGKDFKYSATFEVFPEININELDQDKVEIISCEVKDSDVNEMIEKLREQNKDWHEVSRKVKEGDKVIANFEGFINDEPFEGGKANDFEIVIGSKNMIPGFEEGLIGAQKDKEFDLKVTFPKEYGAQELAGKDATFKVTVTKVMEGKLPALDDSFAEKFNIKGGMDALKKDINDNMTRELERRVSSLNREKIFDKLLEKNAFEIPNSLVNQEIEHLKHEMFHRIFGPEHHDHEKIPDFPRSMFEEQATRRVHLGLLFSEYVKKHQLVADKDRVNGMIDKFAGAYESPEELREWYRGNKERMAEVEALVMEEIVSDKILENAKVSKKTMKYQDVMNPKQEKEEEKEKSSKKESKKESKKDKEEKGA